MKDEHKSLGSNAVTFFKKAVGAIIPATPYVSSSGFQNAQIASAVIQIGKQPVELATNSSPIISTIASFPQIMLALFVLCRSDTRLVDKLLSIFLAIFAIGSFSTATYLYFNQDECTEDDKALVCLLFSFFQILYSSTLASGMALAEASKQLAPKPVDDTVIKKTEGDLDNDDLHEEESEVPSL